MSRTEITIVKLSLFIASAMYDCAGRKHEVAECLILLAVIVLLDIFGWIPTPRPSRTTKEQP